MKHRDENGMGLPLVWAIALAAAQVAAAQEYEVRFGQEPSAGGEAIIVQAIPLGVRVEHRGALYPCCLEYVPTASVEGDVVRFIEADEGGPCDCPDEPWDLFAELRGLAPGTYDVFVRRKEGRLLGTIRIPVPDRVLFIRGNATEDGRVDLADAIAILNYAFAGGPAASCIEAMDADDDGRIGLGDGIYLLLYLFADGAPPPAPFGGPGEDPTADDLKGSGPLVPIVMQEFMRGDTTTDGVFTVGDIALLLNYLFAEGRPPMCMDAADVDDDGIVDINDYCALNFYMFGELVGCRVCESQHLRDVCPICAACCPGPFDAPFVLGGFDCDRAPPPSWRCGPDPTPDALGCRFHPCW